jgi:malonyl-CoA O-methyltransferase
MLKRTVRDNFNRAAERYDAAANTQQAVMRRLAEHLAQRDMPEPDWVLDAGSGTGRGSALLRAAWPGCRIIAADFAERMLPAARRAAHPVCAALETLPFAGHSIDLYWSSLAWQWCALPQAAAEAARVLRPGGVLAVSTLAELTFAELRSAFAGIDPYPHTLPFRAVAEIEGCVAAAGFTAVKAARVSHVEYHAHLRALLRSVKDAGAHSVGGERRPGMLGRSAWQRAEASYEAFRCPQGLPLVYDVLLLTARKR